MTVQWADWTGNTAATWPLESFLGMRVEIAFFETNNSAESRRALIEIIPSASEGAGATRGSWKLASELENPGLVTLHETGDTEVGGVPVVYAVLTLPDDDISEILARRKLTEEETRTMAVRAAGTLAYLHGRGLRHGAVTPPNLFVTGDEVKLAVDTIAPAAGDVRAEDLRQLGATLTEALTGSGDPDAARELPAPFAEIVQGCLDKPDRRWTASRVMSVLTGETPEPAPDATPAPAPIAGRQTANLRWPLAAVFGLVVLAVLGYWLTRPVHREPVVGPVPPPPVQATSPAPVPKPSPIEVEQPQPVPKPSPMEVQRPQPKPVPPRVEPPARQQPSSADSDRSWAVIAATYASFGAAQHRASKFQRILKDSRIRVLPADGQGNLYYVVLGSGMTQAEAVRLRDRAVTSGAPHDSYVTRLKE